MDEVLRWVQDWNLAQSDRDWEHQYGVTIDTIDNPGWSLTISVQDSPLATKELERINTERSDEDWLQCWIGEGKVGERAFCAACGPLNLEEALTAFRDWAHGA